MDSVLVTGANRGIGFEFTKQFYDAGWRVFACCRDPAAEHSRDLNMLAGWSSRHVTVHRLDVTKHDEVYELAKRLEPETIDIVINNAGVNGRVGMWRGGGRFGLSVSAAFVWRCLTSRAMAPFPHPAHRTGRALLTHPALGQDVTPSHTEGHEQPSDPPPGPWNPSVRRST